MGIYSDPRGTTRSLSLSKAVPDNISAPILEVDPLTGRVKQPKVEVAECWEVRL